jgi:hypothetical protein
VPNAAGLWRRHLWGRSRGTRQGALKYSRGRGRGQPSRSSRSGADVEGALAPCVRAQTDVRRRCCAGSLCLRGCEYRA